MTSTEPGPDDGPKKAHPGSFCLPQGATGHTEIGTVMICSIGDKGGRPRWRRHPDHPAATKTSRRRKAALPHVDAVALPIATVHVTTAEAVDSHQSALVKCTCGQYAQVSYVRHGGHEAATELAGRKGKRHEADPDGYPLQSGPHARPEDPVQEAADQDEADAIAANLRKAREHTIITANDGDRQAAVVHCSCGQSGQVPFMGWGPVGALRQAEEDGRAHQQDPPGFTLRARTSPAVAKVPATADDFADELGEALTRQIKLDAEAQEIHAIGGDYRTAGDKIAGEQADKIAEQYRKGLITSDEAANELGGIRRASKEREALLAQAPAAPVRVSGRLLDKEPMENRGESMWAKPGTVAFHHDGRVATALSQMGADRRMDVDGEPLADQLGVILTDSVTGRITPQKELDRIKAIHRRLPPDSRAAQTLGMAIEDLDAPDIPMPQLPASTPAPLRELAAQLHAMPIVRRTKPRSVQGRSRSHELDQLVDLLGQFDRSEISGRRLVSQIEDLRNQHHESEEGKFSIDRAVVQAHRAMRADKELLRRPATY